MAEITILLIGKLVLYFAVCLAAPKLLHISPKERAPFALGWAGARLVGGVFATYPVFLLLSIADKAGISELLGYAVALVVVRTLLWWVVAFFICRRNTPSGTPKVNDWVFLGVCASFAIDGLAWGSGADFKFFC